MSLKHLLKTALQGLSTHKSRSVLTILGIVIGVAAIIVVMTLGQGAEDLIVGEFEALGAETATIQPGTGDTFAPDFFGQVLNDRDLEAILKKANVPNLVDAMPEVVVSSAVAYGKETYKPDFIIGGKADFFIDVFDIYPEVGVPFTDVDVENSARVAMIGVDVKNDLFGASDAVGELIRIKNDRFRVVGVFPKRGNVAFFNLDDLVLIPYTTAQTYLTGTDYYAQIIVRGDSADNIDKLVYDLQATLRETHDIGPDKDDDFVVRTQQGLVDQISTITSILTAFLALVVAISLVVGGIGIMNIMLVSVMERTKEIGLRKAIGATRGDLIRQFLFEAIMLTAAGGVIGVILGTLVALGASVVLASAVATGWSFSFPWGAAALGVGVSAAVGLIFGLYPAYQAAKKSPIDALRYE
ncbi:MAG: multidrug ABC transporter substrate-binding protein [Candidatus Harrisonbacteria bacterium CG10_big_fil_rev_8_21_14_0_10_49_15]|uniref:Multidrug ABC transporter substrate-binding protein n=1 Tax=Candidatus Harrisonbacteria bacterium CG10_big_fil_rev_8_21_14_0_10_49_15 TaxID=1974587 RepID=A0A2H0UK77_9BACT|nr:MAG: multidrug ABC transporter substrate-binding protein [Candidatus Harrisonbacteria bacterium CG10_big_fil_rev_8_21_14_0_10_49_15]